MKFRILLIVALFANGLFAQEFHDTQGKLEIANSGQANFTLPIAMPSSIKDVGPILNLMYSSGQSGGIAGQGWNINGISVISRIASRKDIDGFKDGVDFDDNDKLAYNGQRLLLKTGTYWADGSTYETEVQCNDKIQLNVLNGIYSFIVTTPDGSKTWYGGANASDLNAFYITRFEDTFGNFITYSYNLTSPNSVPSVYMPPIDDPYTNVHIPGGFTAPITSSNVITIDEIRFSANTATNPTELNKIKFTYKLSSRQSDFAYLKGQVVKNLDILDNVQVFTNSLLFKKYQLFHTTDTQGYDRVTKMQESNGSGELANPILFEYNTTLDDISETPTQIYNGVFTPENHHIDLSGDFDGDGSLDFTSGDHLYTKLFQGGGGNDFTISIGNYIRQKFTATTLVNNKLNQKQSIVYANENTDSIDFKIYSLESSGIVNNYTKTIAIDNTGTCSDPCTQLKYDIDGNLLVGPQYPALQCDSPTFKKNSNKYIEGDFNGDGISEVLVLSYIQNHTYEYNPNGVSPINTLPDDPSNPEQPSTPAGSCDLVNHTTTDLQEMRLVDLNPNSSTVINSAGNITLTNIAFLGDGKHFAMDFNSDGKTDLLFVDSNKNYKVISFKQLPTAPWVELEIIGYGILDAYATNKQMLFGDFNGDGKPDIMLPDASGNGCIGCNLWHIYYSNPKVAGGDFFEKVSKTIVDYIPKEDSHETFKDYHSYYAMDINKDGKSDLVDIWMGLTLENFWGSNTMGSNWRIYSFINNGYTFSPYYFSPQDYHSNVTSSLPQVITGSYKKNGVDNEIIGLGSFFNSYNLHFYKTIKAVRFNKNFNQDNLLKKVTQSGGAIVDEITYSPMEPDATSNGLGNTNGFYSSSDQLNYPQVESIKMPTYKLVSLLKNTSLGVVKYQDFKYHGFAVDMNFGVVGFKKTARSSWYRSSSDKKTWSVQENDPLMRGATTKSFSVLLDGTANFDFSNAYTTQKISQSVNEFTQATDSITKRYVLLLNKQINTNYLNNTIKETVYNNYSPDYFLPTIVTSNNYLGATLQGTSTTVTTYDNVVSGSGSGYYIGRPSEVNTTATAYGNTTATAYVNTQTMNEKYFYTNGNLTRTEKKPNNDAVTLIEAFDYFTNGLLKSKTVSATGTTVVNAVSPQTTSYTYDPTNRFVKTITDPELMVTTNLTYHPIYGVVLSHQNPYGQVTTSIFDNWGKQTKVTDFLGKSIMYAYNRANNIYSTTQTGDDGSGSIIESDALARVVRKGSKSLNGNWNYTTTNYDFLGRKTQDSEPYAATDTPTQWTTYEYDDYSRPVATTAHTGKIITTVYNGLTVTVDDGTLIKTKTLDANGQVVSATDTPGGTILFNYNASGNLVESNYEGIKITTQYDNWGRKSQLVDTSAGTYTFTYNAFGQPLTEGTPKGTTTYTYTTTGKLLTKRILGKTAAEATDSKSTYSYDNTNKWLQSIAVINPYDGNSTYNYGYDPITKQLNATLEQLYFPNTATPYAKFSKNITFDNFGRLENETNTAVVNGKTSTKTITTVYQNGAAWQLKDGIKMLWQANTVNARGQLTGASLGNGIAIANTYDSYGYATQNKHTLNTTTNVMTLNTVFEPKLGNLLRRENTLFDSYESFQYDSLDRLTNWDRRGYTMVNLPFDTTTEGFVCSSSDPSIGSISNVSGRMKVQLNHQNVAVTKTFPIGTSTGNKFNIKADLATITSNTTPDVQVSVYVVEKCAGLADTETFIGNYAGTTVLDTNYTVMGENCNNPTISLKFTIATSSTSYNDAVNCSFFVDNVVVNTVYPGQQSYDDRGRITDNAFGSYQYKNLAKPYQHTALNVPIDAPKNSPYLSNYSQQITYTAFKAPIKINQINIDMISFGYNAMQERCVMFYGDAFSSGLNSPYRKYYSADGSMEVKYTKLTGAVEFFTYIGGDAYTAPIVLKSDGTTPAEYFYLHRDYQNSILAITNSVGAVVEKRSFDPWGSVIAVKNGAGVILNKLTFFDRGYTGHEHLQKVGLINMNARLYDVALHRFLSPDSLIQDPYNTQNYNRYGYCVNNPLKYTDITGNDFGVSLIIAIAVAVTSYVAVCNSNNATVTFSGLMECTVTAAFTSSVTFGIGEAFRTTASFWLKATYSALAHGVFQGSMYAVQGGNFWNGFAAGSISSFASSLWMGGSSLDSNGLAIPNSGFEGFGSNGASMIAFGTIAGGAGSALTGGNFWQGAVTGLVVAGLNHYEHMNEYKNAKSRLDREVDNEFNDQADNPAPANESSVNRTLKLPLLKTINSASGNQPFSVDAKNMYWPEDGASEAITVISRPDLKNSNITYFKSSFASYRILAQHVLHELFHAHYNYMGYWKHLESKYDATTARNVSEFYSYRLCNQFAGTPYYGILDYQRGAAFIQGMPYSDVPFMRKN